MNERGPGGHQGVFDEYTTKWYISSWRLRLNKTLLRVREDLREGRLGMQDILAEANFGGEEDRKWDRRSETIQIDKELNLKGKICPYTFIESMLALEEMKVGEVLRVIVDYAPAVCDVPRSLKNEGYEILSVDRLNEADWAIVVRNREFEE